MHSYLILLLYNTTECTYISLSAIYVNHSTLASKYLKRQSKHEMEEDAPY